MQIMPTSGFEHVEVQRKNPSCFVNGLEKQTTSKAFKYSVIW